MFKFSIASVSTSLVFAAEVEGHNDHDLAFKNYAGVMSNNMRWTTGSKLTSNDLLQQLNVSRLEHQPYTKLLLMSTMQLLPSFKLKPPTFHFLLPSSEPLTSSNSEHEQQKSKLGPKFRRMSNSVLVCVSP